MNKRRAPQARLAPTRQSAAAGMWGKGMKGKRRGMKCLKARGRDAVYGVPGFVEQDMEK